MKFLCEYKPKKQPTLTYTRVTKKAIIDHKTKRIQLREDRHIFELTMPNIVSGVRDATNKLGKMYDQLCDKVYEIVGRLLVPACYAV